MMNNVNAMNAKNAMRIKQLVNSHCNLLLFVGGSVLLITCFLGYYHSMWLVCFLKNNNIKYQSYHRIGKINAQIFFTMFLNGYLP